MSGTRRAAMTVAAVLVIVSTPVFWLLDGPDTGHDRREREL